jgi:uncharacterized membrane protein YphA (DoxX/SURF4 family)
MRILVGYGFIEHGFAKLSRGPDAFASMRFKGPVLFRLTICGNDDLGVE